MAGGVGDEAAFIQQEGEEGAAGGECLGEIGEHRLRQVPANEGQGGADSGIAGGLAETGEEIGQDLHRGSLSSSKKAASRRLGSWIRGQREKRFTAEDAEDTRRTRRRFDWCAAFAFLRETTASSAVKCFSLFAVLLG